MLIVNHLTKLLQIAILAAITYILTLIAIPIVPIAPYLKLDLSDLPILVGTVTLGVEAGISVAALATFLHLLINGFALPAMLGDFIMLIGAVVLVITLGGLKHFFQNKRSLSRKVLLIMTLTINLTVVMALINMIAIPLEMKMLGMTVDLPIIKIIIFGVIPFNIVKGILIGTLFLIINGYLQRSKHLN